MAKGKIGIGVHPRLLAWSLAEGYAAEPAAARDRGRVLFTRGVKPLLDCYDGRVCIAFRATLERLPALLVDERFFEAPYAARHGWVCLFADRRLNGREVETLLQNSYRQVALKRMVAALD